MCMVSDKLADFNPHSRVGSDLAERTFLQVYRHFNPHSRVGSDINGFRMITLFEISIHTPA